MATVGELEVQSREDEAVRSLAKACPLPVLYARLALVKFGREYLQPSEDPPSHYILSFQAGSYLHFKQEYSSDWWIGRVIGHEPRLGFLPSEIRLRAAIDEEATRKSAGDGEVYQAAPLMRPVVLLGPSSRESRLTELLQKALVGFMRECFAGRLSTVKPGFSVCDMMDKEVARLEEEVGAAGASLQLVFLDSDASFPSDLQAANIHPMFVYVQVSQQKVLHRLVEQLTAKSRDRQAQLDAAHYLHEQSSYVLTLSDSDLDDACQTLELFLEHYWVATRSVIPLPSSGRGLPS